MCRNDLARKRVEVADGMSRFGDYPGMADLYCKGAFRHLGDVAFARCMLERNTPIDKIAEWLDEAYSQHDCDRIYAPS